ncbi:acyl CoA:acetate/3-ketoacid CoA transferase [Roseomonas hellenica]|uniref:Acetate CoA-transferase YdiF n=1 Tax=Plastoroseomonas hellenica TaxID=2687306 RepID=A0ABS5F064_9PROT|nr:CoA-transferase [Plastoroseomonas hellenica]MBR0665939.1 acyl CoA:acetate/3-ketoacid CoA transferase [Plastoroseomonas hellenica]
MAATVPRCITAEAAAALIQDGDFVIIGGNGGTGTPEALIEAVERRFLAGQGPHDLTLFHVTGIGAVHEHGLCHFGHQGLVKRVIGGHYGLQVPFMALIDGNHIEAYNFPQGVMTGLCRAMASGQPGILTHVGLGTYMDPRQEGPGSGGRMNARTTETLVDHVRLMDRDWLFYRVPGAPRVALIRGTTADEDGYVTMEHEATTREDLSIAQAVHNAGGIVICQVKRIARRGSLNPQMVKIPGFLIDHIVVEPEQMQTFGTQYDPSRSGETRIPTSSILPDPMSERRIMARRAALELCPGDVVNLGVGVSAMIPNVAAEEGIEDLITLTVEAGVIGGVPGHAREFGTAVNPRAIIDQGYQFDFYDGGGLSCAFLSFAEVDPEGNVNVTKFGNRFAGAGGFIDITQNTRRLVFSGTLTGGGLDIGLTEGGIAIRSEGRMQKFVPAVEQVSFSGRLARQKGQEVTFVTERAVFELEPDGLVLTEIAPGARLQEDVLDQMGFRPLVSPALQPMDARLFRPGPMALREAFLAQAARPRPAR